MTQKIGERDTALREEKEDLQEALTAVRNTEERWRALTEHVSDYIVVLDAQLRSQYLSPTIETILGYKPAERIGRTPLDLIHPNDLPEIERQMQETLCSPRLHRPRAFRYRMRHKDGTYRHLEGVSTNLLDNPAVQGIVVNLRDTTEKVHAEEEIQRQRETLHQRDKLAAMGSLLAGVAHEINNPLSVVVGRAIMLEDVARDAETQTAAGKIRVAAERCVRIVKSFLAMARQHEQQKSTVRMNDIIDSSLDVLEYTLRTSGIQIVRDLAPYLPELHADADQLPQVFMNLFVNAQQAMADSECPKTLKIITRYNAAEQRVQVIVTDTGPGIPAEIRSRIFDPYFTTKPMGTGTGVGLSISLGIVEAHGGTLSVDFPPEGGAQFTVMLPVVPSSKVTAREVETVTKFDRRRVLVVDDEEEVREMLGDILKYEHHDVELCTSGKEALDRLIRARYDVIFSDLRMPEMDGPALYREVEGRWPPLAQRFIFVTGDSLSSAFRKFLADVKRPVIEKPFTPSNVRRAVAEVYAASSTQSMT